MTKELEKTRAALAAALKNIRDLLDADVRGQINSGTRAEAERFLEGVEDGTLPAPRRFQVVVTQSDHDMPGYGAYLAGSVSEEPGDDAPRDEGGRRIPTGLVLLNLDATLWTCLAHGDLDWKEIAAESVGHELLHIVQELLGVNLAEWHINESLEKARDAGIKPDEPGPETPPEWAERLDTFLSDSGAGAVVVLVDEGDPEQSFVLEKVVPDAPPDSSGWVAADWRVIPSVVGVKVDVSTDAKDPDHTYTVWLPVKDEPGEG